jgi:hypothetical protein
MARPRYLTKSRFKLAVECPTKLAYTGRRDVADASQSDEFLQALAEGGFQVGELAKLMYPGGVEIREADLQAELNATSGLLQRDEVTLFEAAVEHEGLFARVDVLVKRGDEVHLIEVKAKSVARPSSLAFLTTKDRIDRAWLPYLQDIAFQVHVFRKAWPHLKVKASLMLADKSATCTVEQLNQKFRVWRDASGRPQVRMAPGLAREQLGESILCTIAVDDLVDRILREPLAFPGGPLPFAEAVRKWETHYREDRAIAPVIGAHCGHCQFHVGAASGGQRDGRRECWLQAQALPADEAHEPTVLELWNFPAKKHLIAEGVFLMRQVREEHLQRREDPQGLSRGDRHWFQVSGQWPGGGDFYLDDVRMRREMQGWRWPLHFIDFETARVALPFFKGQRPYGNVAFQFSHHVMEADGSVRHAGEFLRAAPGAFPNYDFARALLRALGGDAGTVFMWSPHENTTLNAIAQELEADADPPGDAPALLAFLRSLTREKDRESKATREGERAMVDLCALAQRTFFHPATKGSSSIKKVLPAVMQSSALLRRLYGAPVYGAEGGIPSLNFVNQTWWQERDGVVVDAYRLLEPVFQDVSPQVLTCLDEDEELLIAQGGAATAAYARLQFEDLSPQAREYIERALKRYCELDTLAMVMVVQAWRGFL